jgi:hypothetical protein
MECFGAEVEGSLLKSLTKGLANYPSLLDRLRYIRCIYQGKGQSSKNDEFEKLVSKNVRF